MARWWKRRWLRLALAVGVLLAGALVAGESWAAWQERCARLALADDRLDDARRHAGRALWGRKGRASTHLLAARIARLQGAYSQAEQHLLAAGRGGEMSEPLQVEWLLLRCQRGEVDELSAGLLALVGRDHPESDAILEALASVYMRQTRYLEALRCLDAWVARAPDCVRALDWRGWVSNQLDHRGQAIGDYERALELQPGRSAVRLRLAEILVESARHAEAVPHLELLLHEQADNPDVRVALARCRMVQSRPDDARALLDAVLEAHPGHFDTLFHKGEVELGVGNHAAAERWLRQALERSPRNPEARYSLYLCLKAQPGRAREAQKELARWKEDRQSRDRLTRLMRTELAASPNDAKLAAEAGELFLRLGEDQPGVFWLQRALALDPRHAGSHRALIAYYERTNEPARAAEHREKLAALGEPRGGGMR